MGDDAIKKTYECIKKTFGRQGSCYRIGGDEFAGIIFHGDEMLFKELTEEFYVEIKKIEQTVKYPFYVSLGYDVFDPEKDKNGYEAFYARVDRLMYENKNQSKSI